MAIKTFAAIDVGSFEMNLKIYEISGKNGIRPIDDIRHRLDLGSDTYASEKISYENVNELCNILKEFKNIMQTYKVSAYKAYGTSAIREALNTKILLDHVSQRTGIQIDVLSNSEQRFMNYKAIAYKNDEFNKMLEQDTAILDIGGGSIQLSLFEKGTLTTTQNMRLGVLRLQERLMHLNASSLKMEELIDEMITSQLSVFKKMYLKDRDIKNVIVVDDYLSNVLQKHTTDDKHFGYMKVKDFFTFQDDIHNKTVTEIADSLNLSRESAGLLYISATLVKQAAKMMGAELLWAPGVTLCDGIAYEYAERNKIIHAEHDFEADIITSAEHISKRYMGSKKRSETLEKIALTIFDSMKKVHGLSKRERLLLQLATLLHDCGKYISMVNLGECSYHIIMSTGIIGLSHREREIVANVVQYNHLPFEYFDSWGSRTTLDADAYLIISKLSAILKVANGLDRSHKQKFKNVKTTLKDRELIIQIDTAEDITLEKGLFTQRADFFEEVYNIRPIIKQKKTL